MQETNLIGQGQPAEAVPSDLSSAPAPTMTLCSNGNKLTREELAQVKKAGVDKIHFAYAGGTEAGEPHTYRVRGPSFVIEFLNVQDDSAHNKANHIHSAWRNIQGDFGTAAE